MSRTSQYVRSSPDESTHSDHGSIISYRSPLKSFTRGEAYMRDEQLELSCPKMATIVKEEEEYQRQNESKSSKSSENTYLNIRKDWLPARLQKTAGLLNQSVDEPAQSCNFQRCSQHSPRILRSTFRSGRRTSLSQPLDSKTRFEEPGCNCLVSRKSTSFVPHRSNDDSGREFVVQDTQDFDTIHNPRTGRGFNSHSQVPEFALQKTRTKEEYHSECVKPFSDVKSSGDEDIRRERVQSCLSKQLISPKISGGRKLKNADTTISNSQDFIKTLDIGSDIVALKCIGTTQKGNRCRIDLSKSTCFKVQRTLKRLISLDLPRNIKAFLDQLELLAYLMLYKRIHQNSQPLTLIKCWEETLAGIVPRDLDPRLAETTLRSDEPALTTIDVGHRQKKQVYTSKDSFTIFKTEFNEHYSIRRFIPFDPKARSMASIRKFLRRAITRDLTKREMTKSGSIYIYWFPGNFGLLKIGVTTLEIEQRLKKWKSQCGHHPHLVHPVLEIDRQSIPHVYRVEALVQAELRNCRMKEVRCQGCGMSHKEWFEKPLGDAIAAVKKWSAWIKEAPYREEKVSEWDTNSQPTISYSKWTLKRELLADVQALSKEAPKPPSPRSPPPQHQRPRIGRNPSDPETLRNRNRSRGPSFTRSIASKKRSKSDAPEHVTVHPHFSGDFIDACANQKLLSTLAYENLSTCTDLGVWSGASSKIEN